MSLDHIPEILPYEASGRVTSTTIVLGQPLCYFNTLTQLKCSQSTCQVWAAIASGPGWSQLDVAKYLKTSRDRILTLIQSLIMIHPSDYNSSAAKSKSNQILDRCTIVQPIDHFVFSHGPFAHQASTTLTLTSW